MIYLHHRRATKFSSIRKFPPKRENVWTLRIVESWFHSDRSTFLGKVSGKMRYRWVGNSEILVGYDAHLPPSSSASPLKQCTGCADIFVENFSKNRQKRESYHRISRFYNFFLYFPRKWWNGMEKKIFSNKNCEGSMHQLIQNSNLRIEIIPII